MDTREIFRLLTLYVHLLAFALAISAIIWEDLRLVLRGASSLSVTGLQATSRIVMPSLALLILTGAGLCAFDVSLHGMDVMTRPKMLSKLTVVAVLVANGVALHAFAFPALQRPCQRPRQTAVLLCLMGSVSSVSWLYAGFLGIARPLATVMHWQEFMVIHLFLVAMAFAASLLWIGQPLVKRLSPGSSRSGRARDTGPSTSADSLMLAHGNH